MFNEENQQNQRKISELEDEMFNLYQQGEYEKAIGLAIQSCNIAEVHLGKNNPDYATKLSNLAEMYRSIGDYKASEQLYLQAIEIQNNVLNIKHPNSAIIFNGFGVLYNSMGKFEDAMPLFRQAMEIIRVTDGEKDPKFATTINSLAESYREMGNYAEALPLYLKALEIRREILGELNPDFAVSLTTLSTLHKSMGNYKDAEKMCLQAIEIFRKILGENHPYLANCMTVLGGIYLSMGNYIAAEPLYIQAKEIWRTSLGEKHPYFSTGLNNLADLYEYMGHYNKSEQLIRQSLEISRITRGEKHPAYATTLMNLAGLLKEKGDYKASIKLYQQCIEIQYISIGKKHPDLAISLMNLSNLYRLIGDYDSAITLIQQALEIWRAKFGDEHPEIAIGMSNLAGMYIDLGDYELAEYLMLKTKEILSNVSENHPHLASILNNLATLYFDKGNFADAEQMFLQALEIIHNSIGEENPHSANILMNLALLNKEEEDYLSSEKLYRRVIEIIQNTHGKNHPSLSTAYNNLACLYAITNREVEALALMQKAAIIDDKLISQIFSIGSERQRMAYLHKTQLNFNLYLSLISRFFSNSPLAIQDAMDLILRRKAIGLEALAAKRDSILSGKYPHLRDKFNKFNILKMQIARKTIEKPGPEGIKYHNDLLIQWNKQKEKLELELVHQIPEMNLEQKVQTANLHAVFKNLPIHYTLIEFIKFDLIDFRVNPRNEKSKWKRPHYLAFILSEGNPNNVHMIDIGDADTIDLLISEFRGTITSEGQSKSIEIKMENLGVKLREIIFDKLLEFIGECTHFLIAPDGNLSIIPFEILPLKNGERLIDKYNISYLTVGRDVLRFNTEFMIQAQKPIIIADPEFNLIKIGEKFGDTDKKILQNRQSLDFDLSKIFFPKLPGTRIEGKKIGDKIGVEPWFDENALEGRLKNRSSPSILHIATHGFFIPDQQIDLNNELQSKDFYTIEDIVLSRIENPLIRSGLALAGANNGINNAELPPEAEDGILTAEDVSGLDLFSTDLVVLSACDTGLGVVSIGEGVMGLRRTFMLAGTKTLIMSLWKISDQKTPELMEEFYDRILSGQSRAKALREAQLTLKKKYPHPKYWGAFICLGNPSPLNPQN